MVLQSEVSESVASTPPVQAGEAGILLGTPSQPHSPCDVATASSGETTNCDAESSAIDFGHLGSFGDEFSTNSAQTGLRLCHSRLAVSVRTARNDRRRRNQQAAAPVTKSAASYSRYSSDLQRQESIDDQQRICRDAAERNGHILPTDLQFADSGVSGARRDREGLNEMIAAAERGELQTLYLYSLSRLARESLITLSLLKRLVFKFHVRVISISDGIDTNVTNWELIAAIMSVVGEQYLRELSAAVLRGQEGIVLARLCVGDYCFGYNSKPIPGSENARRGRNPRPHKAYVINETTAAWIERIFSWFVKDKWSLAEIARELTRCHVPKDHRSTTAVWTAKNVRSVLENEKYIGIWPWGTMKNERDPETG